MNKIELMSCQELTEAAKAVPREQRLIFLRELAKRDNRFFYTKRPYGSTVTKFDERSYALYDLP